MFRFFARGRAPRARAVAALVAPFRVAAPRRIPLRWSARRVTGRSRVTKGQKDVPNHQSLDGDGIRSCQPAARGRGAGLCPALAPV